MIRATNIHKLQHFAQQSSPLQKQVLYQALKSCSFSTNVRRKKETAWQNDDAFDESDALETGKDKMTDKKQKIDLHPQQKQQQQKTQTSSSPRRSYETSPLYRPPFRGFVDFFDRDPFFSHVQSMLNSPLFDLHRQLDTPFRSLMPVLRSSPGDQKNKGADKRVGMGQINLTAVSPGYEIKESNNLYEISMDIPEGVSANDVHVELEDDGKILCVSGQRKQEEDGMVTQTSFQKRFHIGENVEIEKMTANLHDNLLVVCAPKVHVEELPQRIKIPVTSNPHLTEEEIVNKTYSDEFDESDFLETGKAKPM